MSETTTTTQSNRAAERSSCCSNQKRQQSTYLPSFDVWRNADRIVLKGDVPGVQAANLDIRLEEGKLFLKASVTPRSQQKEFLRREYGVGDFEREFAVGETVDAEAVTATLVDGVVTIDLPFAAKARPHRVDVRTA